MKRLDLCVLFLIVFMVISLGQMCRAEIVLIGKGSISGDAFDSSLLTGNLEDGTPANRMGGFGSGLAYTGKGNRYVVMPDRGPSDGITSYKNRFYEMDITVVDGKVQATLFQTHLFSNKDGKNFIGLSSAFDPAYACGSLRLDPEGIRLSRYKTVFVSDEYGPCIYEFDLQTGKYLNAIDVPEKFKIKNADAASEQEFPPRNVSGRQPNRGMEGLAITPDGHKLVGIMQSPLMQDHGLDANNKRVGLNIRILMIDLRNKSTKEFLYPLGDENNGINEILAFNEREFLVIERDSRKGAQAKDKKIYAVDTSGATDIREVGSLFLKELPSEIKPVKKTLFIDLLDPRFGLAGEAFPEKIEGLAFGPDSKDGRHLLLVTSDNDFNLNNQSWFFAFSIDRKDLPRFQQQTFEMLKTNKK